VGKEGQRFYAGNPSHLVERICAAFGVTPDELVSGRRSRHRTLARHVATLALKELGYFSYSDLARILHYADHTSVLSALAAARMKLAKDRHLRAMFDLLMEQLRAPALDTYPRNPRESEP